MSEVNTGNGAYPVLSYTEKLGLTLSFPYWEVITLSLALERPHKGCCTQFWATAYSCFSGSYKHVKPSFFSSVSTPKATTMYYSSGSSCGH